MGVNIYTDKRNQLTTHNFRPTRDQIDPPEYNVGHSARGAEVRALSCNC